MESGEARRQAREVLAQVFGYHSFRPPQEEIIEHLIAGGSALVLMPTGGGKSLCYQIPALVRPGMGLVISPLIALMQDQVNALRANGVRAAFLNSTLSAAEARRVWAALYAGQIDILYVSPERALMEGFQQVLQEVPLSLIAIDEAHCISQWGHDFRPEYVQLAQLRQLCPQTPLVALTATADVATRQDIIRYLELEEARHFITSFDRPNIRYYVQAQSASQTEIRRRFISFVHERHPQDAGIIYCLSRKDVEKTCQWLRDLGFNAWPYHAGLSAEERAANQERFLQEEAVLMVATVAFGMGVDKPNVRFVAHFNLPSSLEAYYQETGRAGRDGLPSSAWLSYSLSDIALRQNFIEQSEAPEQQKRIERRKLRALLGFCETTTCRRQALLEYFGEEAPDHCQNCDNCLEPPRAVDGLTYAQKALSCVYRTGQMYGVGHLVDILRGAKTSKISEKHHDELSTYAIGRDLSASQWHSIFRQLTAAGYLRVDLAGYGGLKLTKRSREILTGAAAVSLRLESEAPKERKKRMGASVGIREGDSEWPADQVSQLLALLRQKRMQLAREAHLPPYLVLHDATLLALAQGRPHSLEEVAQISGFGAVKLRQYGPIMLKVIRDFEEGTLLAPS